MASFFSDLGKTFQSAAKTIQKKTAEGMEATRRNSELRSPARRAEKALCHAGRDLLRLPRRGRGARTARPAGAPHRRIGRAHRGRHRRDRRPQRQEALPGLRRGGEHRRQVLSLLRREDARSQTGRAGGCAESAAGRVLAPAAARSGRATRASAPCAASPLAPRRQRAKTRPSRKWRSTGRKRVRKSPPPKNRRRATKNSRKRREKTPALQICQRRRLCFWADTPIPRRA